MGVHIPNSRGHSICRLFGERGGGGAGTGGEYKSSAPGVCWVNTPLVSHFSSCGGTRGEGEGHGMRLFPPNSKRKSILPDRCTTGPFDHQPGGCRVCTTARPLAGPAQCHRGLKWYLMGGSGGLLCGESLPPIQPLLASPAGGANRTNRSTVLRPS